MKTTDLRLTALIAQPGHASRRRFGNTLCRLAAIAATALVGGIAPTGALGQSAPPVVVSLTFDDGTADHVLATQILESHGLRGVFYINSSRLGAPGYLTSTQAQDIQAAGHEIGGHTVSHANLPTLDEDEQRRQVCNDRVALLNRGLQATSFAYPFGADSALTKQIIEDCGYNSGRGVGGILSPTSCNGCPPVEQMPPADRWDVRTPISVKSTTSMAHLTGYVQNARTGGGGWVPLVLHRVCDGCSTIAISPALLDEFAAWLAAEQANGVTVATVHQVIGGEVAPPVDGPPPPPPGAGNLVHNAQLMNLQSNGLTPVCWQHGGYGANTRTWSVVSAGHGDSSAQSVSVSGFASGDARLISRWDLGSCAPAAVPGHSYAATGWYKTTANLRLVTYYRNDAGGWVFLRGGPVLPVTSTWTKATLITGPIPPNATGLSVGFSVRSNGLAQLDDFSLTDTWLTDTTPPVSTLTCNPGACPTSAWSAVAQSLTLTAADTGGSGLASIRYTLDGTEPTLTNGVTYTDPIAVTGLTTIRYRAVDLAGNLETVRSASLMVDTVPPSGVAITSPAEGAVVSGITPIQTASSDDVAVVRIRFFVDGVQIGTRTTLPYRWNWDTATLAPGLHVIRVAAQDAAGNTTSSDVVSVTK